MGRGCFAGTRFPFGVMKMLWNEIRVGARRGTARSRRASRVPISAAPAQDSTAQGLLRSSSVTGWGEGARRRSLAAEGPVAEQDGWRGCSFLPSSPPLPLSLPALSSPVSFLSHPPCRHPADGLTCLAPGQLTPKPSSTGVKTEAQRAEGPLPKPPTRLG